MTTAARKIPLEAADALSSRRGSSALATVSSHRFESMRTGRRPAGAPVSGRSRKPLQVRTEASAALVGLVGAVTTAPRVAAVTSGLISGSMYLAGGAAAAGLAFSISGWVWDTVGKNAIFGDEAASSAQVKTLEGVDVTGLEIMSHPQVLKAAAFAAAAHAGQVRRTGEAYVTHCVETGRIVAALLPSDSKRAVAAVVAAILHDVVDDTDVPLSAIAKEFGAEVATLVDGISRLSQINQLLRRRRRQATAVQAQLVDGGWASVTGEAISAEDSAALRSLILGVVDDPRMVLVKLADRLHNMRTLHVLDPDKASAVANETLAVWCSLAARLGAWAIKAELEDLCFAVLLPSTFFRLKRTLDIAWASGRKMTPAEYDRQLGEVAEAFRGLGCDPADLEGPGARLSAEQRRTRALLGCVLPFDLLTQRVAAAGKPAGAQEAGGGAAAAAAAAAAAPASAAGALEALDACKRALREELAINAWAAGLEITIQGRLKSLWSTHCKMQRKNAPVMEIFDARALRVVVSDAGGDAAAEVTACYRMLGAVHRLWRPVRGEYDDYIANPKKSGYRSLHTAVLAADGLPLEVQIRTRAMHEDAEYGAAAHWLYKDAAPAPGAVAVAAQAVPVAALPVAGPGAAGPLSGPPPPVAAVKGAGGAAGGGEAAGRLPIERKLAQSVIDALPATSAGGAAAAAAAAAAVASAAGAAVNVAASVAAAAASALPSPPRKKTLPRGTPLLRVAGGNLCDAVVLGPGDEGKLLVAVRFGPRSSAAEGRQARQEDFDSLLRHVEAKGFFYPGQGDWDTLIEEYALGFDGRWRRQDCYGHKMPQYVQPLELAQQPPAPPPPAAAAAASEAPAGPGASASASASAASNKARIAESSNAEALNDKIRMLRSMLMWERDLTGSAGAAAGAAAVEEEDGPGADPAAAMPLSADMDGSSADVIILTWPDGRVRTFPRGTTVGAVSAAQRGAQPPAQEAGSDAELVNVNNKLVNAETLLSDGDIVILA